MLLLWNVGTSVWLGSHAGASSGVFSFEARHHAEWASTGQHLELLLLITARGSLAGAPAGRHDSGIYSYEARHDAEPLRPGSTSSCSARAP